MNLICKEFVFPFKEGECHASTLLRLTDGAVLTAWFGGSKEGNLDVQIWLSRRENGVWSTPVSVPTAVPVQHWNPVLFQTDDETVTLFYKIGKPIDVWQTMVIRSTDGGRTWTAPEELVAGDESGGRGPVKNKPILTSDGRILAPASTEHGTCWRCFVDEFDGNRWIKHPDFPVDGEDVGVIQPTLWEDADGKFHALMRSNQGKIYRADSADGGRTFGTCYATDLPNNNSGLDAVMTEGGTLVLVCNPVEKNWGPRSPLSVFVSTDNGETFDKALDLETEQGEFSYPAIVADGNHVSITYTYKRQSIVFCQLML